MLHYRKLKPALVGIALTITAEVFSCTTVQGASSDIANGKSQSSKKSLRSANDAPSEPAKVQLSFQEEFARQLAKAGPKSEGWALFSDSPMTHDGQRWIIRTNDPKNDEITFCLITQGEKSCKLSKMTKKQFEKIEPSLRAGDKLNHILTPSFDALSYEFLHAYNSNPLTKRVVFISGINPFPEAYNALIKAFEK